MQKVVIALFLKSFMNACLLVIAGLARKIGEENGDPYDTFALKHSFALKHVMITAYLGIFALILVIMLS